MRLSKWNWQTHAYEPYLIPDNWILFPYSANFDEPVNCAGCGLLTTYGASFTSLAVHTPSGIGYPVCEGCYNAELVARAMAV